MSVLDSQQRRYEWMNERMTLRLVPVRIPWIIRMEQPTQPGLTIKRCIISRKHRFGGEVSCRHGAIKALASLSCDSLDSASPCPQAASLIASRYVLPAIDWTTPRGRKIDGVQVLLITLIGQPR